MARPRSNFDLRGMNPEVRERVLRLREAVKLAGGNKAVLPKTGLSSTALSNYLAGQDMKLGRAIELAEACGVSLEWLATGREAADPASTDLQQVGATLPPMATHITIPRLDVRASAGAGTEVVAEDVTALMSLDEQFIRQQLRRRPEDLRLITAQGDSMDPTIRDGDLLLVDTSVTEVAGSRIYVLEIGNALLVKRIHLLLDRTLVVRSDNEKYPEERVHPSDRNPIRIIGQVVYQAGPVRS